MKIIILGAGAIGSLYGARLSRKNEVLLVARKSHADSINRNGLRIENSDGKVKGVYDIRAVSKLVKIEKNTLILLTTKVNDSATAISDIKNIARKDTVILCLQNGLGSENSVKKIMGKKCTVLRGITSFGASFLSDGIVRQNNEGYTAIEKSIFSKEIAENFSRCGLNAYVSKDIRTDVWKKLAVNCVLNPLSAILKVENGKIADEIFNPLKQSILDECVFAAEKNGVELDLTLKEINNMLKGSRNISSMLQDITKKRRTEIDYINGAVAKLGEKYNIGCPVNKGLVMFIKCIESR